MDRVPELPDLSLYLERLAPLIVDQPLEGLRLRSAFLVRSVSPPLEALVGKRVVGLRRLGKRVVWEFEGQLFLVIHLMIAGRFHWKRKGASVGGRNVLAAFDFLAGTLQLTEASPRKRASLFVVSGERGLEAHDPGGLEIMSATLEDFAVALTTENHTLKRALTDPTLFSGIGNAYSDEILHRARLSPFKRTTELPADEVAGLFAATRATLAEWTDRLREESPGFPEKVTAFRPQMAVHGRYGLPCPVCGTPVQRIVYAENEANYCPHCQTGGRLLADRALSRLLKTDWPRSLAELEERKRRFGVEPLTPSGS
jgi:formamidopyrimidine-DNA glycosylase